MTYDLTRKLRALQSRIDCLKALMAFLKKHPVVASRSLLHHSGGKTSLHFEEKAIVRPVSTKDGIVLRLEKYLEFDAWVESIGDVAKRTICTDVSNLPREQLDEVLKKLNIILDDPNAEEPESDWHI